MNVKINEFISKINNKKIHVVGLSSTECLAFIFFLSKFGINSSNLTVHDFSADENDFIKSFNNNHVAHLKEERAERLNKLKNLNLKINYKNTYLKNIEEADYVFVSQNWFNYSCNFPYLKNAEKKNIPFINITDIYFTLVPCPIIAITGSNGKTTSSNLVFEILKLDTNKKVYFTGNDRYAKQLLEDIDLISEQDIFVMEISNRQLINFKNAPYISVITNILPNHIEEHGSYENYINTKFNIFANQKPSDIAIVNYDNDITKNFIQKIKSKIFPFSRKEFFNDNGVYEKNSKISIVSNGKTTEICNTNDIKLQGEHNIENILAAVGACFIIGAKPEDIKQGISDFGGIKNRMELIRKVNNVSYYNDLASTSPQATVAALRALRDNIILIAGGHDKGMDYTELTDEIKLKVKKLILLPGRGTEKIISSLPNFNYSYVDTLEEAMDIAKENSFTGDKIILSPACASFYSLYVDGKEGFNKLVKRLH